MTQPIHIRRGRMPRLLDAFCCQGGAGKGYADAGFDITGIDKAPQPRYPYPFIQGDAVAFIREHGAEFDFIHPSPPCQHDSDCQRIQGNAHPDLIGPTRTALESTGRPWVIENVRGALPKLNRPVMLCGAMFALATYRHRHFETGGGFTLTPPNHPVHMAPQAKMGRPVPPGWYGQYVGNFSGVPLARAVMDVPWMNRNGIRECIPPAYTAWIGRAFLAPRTLEAAA
ncbi:DNA cytosine methyltransferase [Streptomyces lunaelactis]|uniref:DNA cytosine methyltransferase n=1 Tax=Streptomyces lunaelactis TaxID=1535768 RepID=UPI001585C083|nr:DNA cytosine methyltransferase [Streptomyces lunaelactis]NUK18455.1 DNA cytosine methyltransferase [Streptomyces lunaelactis]